MTSIILGSDCTFRHTQHIVCVHVCPPQSSLSCHFSIGRQRFALLSWSSGCIIQTERRGLPQWLNIMTCEPIKQLIRNSNEADDDEGDAGENFIAIINPLSKNNLILLSKERNWIWKERRWRDPVAVCYCTWSLLTQLKTCRPGFRKVFMNIAAVPEEWIWCLCACWIALESCPILSSLFTHVKELLLMRHK